MVGNYITSFIGFLPADHPEVIVYIAVDNAKGVTQYGGTIAAPIAKNILTSAISILGIEEREDGMMKEFNYIDKTYYVVPNVVGMNVKDATKELKQFKVEYTGTGNTVSYQSPKANSQIYEGETVRLLLTE